MCFVNYPSIPIPSDLISYHMWMVWYGMVYGIWDYETGCFVSSLVSIHFFPNLPSSYQSTYDMGMGIGMGREMDMGMGWNIISISISLFHILSYLGFQHPLISFHPLHLRYNTYIGSHTSIHTQWSSWMGWDWSIFSLVCSYCQDYSSSSQSTPYHHKHTYTYPFLSYPTSVIPYPILK